MTEHRFETAGLHARVVRGLGWTTGAALAVQVSRLAFGIVLARLLTPHEYGIAGMALVFAALVLAVSDVGLGAGLVQRPTITEEDRSTVFWTSVGAGAILAATGVALSGPVASFYGEPEVQPLFIAVSFGFFLTGFGRAHAALYLRDMAFRAISIRVMAATVAGGVVAVFLAARGFGPWALVGLHLTNGVVATLLLWVMSPWRPHLLFSPRSLRDLGGFGLNVFGAKLLEYVNGNADKLLVGRFLGSSALGVYSVAYNLVMVPFASLLVALTDALFPAMSRVQEDLERMAGGWLRAGRALVALMAPAMLGVVVVAPDFVQVILGERWNDAVPILQILALAALIYSASAFGSTVLTAADRTTTLLRFSVAEVGLILGSLVIGLQWGVVGVAFAYLAAITVTRAWLAALTARTLDVTLARFGKSLAGVAQAVVVMLVAIVGVRLALVSADVPAAARLVIVTISGIAAYLPLCLWRAPEVLEEVRAIRRVRAHV